MSHRSDSAEPAKQTERADAGSLRQRVGNFCFGDSVGLTLWIGALVFYAIYWRVGFFIADSVTIANTLANVVEGRLAVTGSPYAFAPETQPGLVEVDGTLYGRNYGHVFLALPVYAALELVGAITDLRLALAGVWSLLVVWLFRRLGGHTGRDTVAILGAGIGLVAFLGSVAVGTPIEADQYPIVALQLTTMVVAAFAATTFYRLIRYIHGHRVGTAAGLGFVLATPVSVWATIPKRHVLTAGVIVLTLYCFAVSRDPESGLRARAGAYASLGLLAFLHPFEAIFLFVVFAPLDLVTAPRTDRFSTAILGGVFVLSVLPMLVVNTLISGNPLRVPRLLSGIPDDFTGHAPAEQSNGESSGVDTSPDGESTLLPGPIGEGIDFSTRIVGFMWEAVRDGLGALREPERLYHTFVRSGWIPGLRYEVNGFETIELSLLESFPLFAALLWIPVAASRRIRAIGSGLGLKTVLPTTPAGQTDLLAAGYGIVFTLVYLPRLPLISQITVRYILPVVPIVLYGVVRFSVINRSIETEWRTLAGSYLTSVLIGGVALFAVLLTLEPAAGEAMQLHAWIGIGTGIVGTVAILTYPIHDQRHIVAAGIGLPAAATTLLILYSGIAYFQYGPFGLDLVRVFAEWLPTV